MNRDPRWIILFDPTAAHQLNHVVCQRGDFIDEPDQTMYYRPIASFKEYFDAATYIKLLRRREENKQTSRH